MRLSGFAWVRTPEHDSYRFHRDLFLSFLPVPCQKILDVGCGEGRLSNDLAQLGHTVGLGCRDGTASEGVAASGHECDLDLGEGSAGDLMKQIENAGDRSWFSTDGGRSRVRASAIVRIEVEG
jgi:SAM-dependent methyltransferase